MNKLRVGVIGCGFVASKWHIPGFLRLKQKVSVEAVCDLNPSLAKSTAEEFNISKSYSDLSKMLGAEDLDIIDICTPPHTHAPLAIEAMEKGCHILLEKPMALKLSDCDEMIHVSRKQNVKFCIIHNERFRPPMLRAVSLVEKGELGKLLGMQWRRFTPRDEYLAIEKHWIHKLPGGVLGETGPHAIYASLAFLKKIESVEISAKNILKYPWAPYDYFNITLEGEKINSSIILSHASDNYVADITIFGTEKIIKIDLQNMSLSRYQLKSTKMLPLAMSSFRSAGQTIGNVFSNGAKAIFTRDYAMRVRGHSVEIEMFVDSVISDQQPPVTAEEGRETVRVLEILVEKLNRKS